MKKYLSLGKFDKYYCLIISSALIKLLMNFITGFFPSLKPNDPIFLFGFPPILLSHPLLNYAIEFFGITIFGLIFRYIFHQNNKDIGKLFIIESNTKNACGNNILSKRSYSSFIHHDIFSKNNKLFLKQIFAIFIFYYYGKLSINLLDGQGFHILKIWAFEYISIYYFSKKFLNKTIYKHQILALFLTLIFSTLLYFISSFIPEANTNCNNLIDEKYDECILLTSNVYQKVIYKLSSFFIPIIVVVYFLAIISNSYVFVKFKWFIDLKYISIYKILTVIGFLGLIISLLIFFLLSYIPCTQKYKFFKDFCKFKYGNSIYYDTFKVLKNIKINNDFLLELIIILPIYMLLKFVDFYFCFLIIKKLDPFYLLVIPTVQYLIYETIDFILGLSNNNVNYIHKSFFCLLADIISLFDSLVYLEILELNFCGFNKNLRKHIINRSNLDINSTADLFNQELNDIMNDSTAFDNYEMEMDESKKGKNKVLIDDNYYAYI